ncbi:MAG: ATP-binding cassette domain-containing protein [Promethearchaeota archaeon]|nr:MAG: ATP-binding cassette domain-containing protein [Candidatus Lokiarchaeota archaeon]
MSENIIEIKNLTKIYEDGDVLAVDDISLSIKKGEIFALLGPNGAGKTTTISMLATLLNVTKGSAIVNGFDVKEDPDKVRKSIGIVFQEPSLDNEMKGWENLELHGVLYGMPKKQRREKIKEVLKLVDLEEKAKVYAKNYSGGMKRRLEIARGLLHEPKVLFLDEPTLGLDPQTRRKIWEKIKELNQGPSKITILITTHYMEEADELADRICIMDHGKIIALDTSENLKKQLSGDIIDIDFEQIEDSAKLPTLINSLNKLPMTKNVTLGSGMPEEMPLDIQPPPGVNPEMMKARMREMMSDPKKLIHAWKKYPVSSQMFLNAPLEIKKRIANLFNEDQIKQIPEPIQEEIIKIRKGEISVEYEDLPPRISVSCENGGKCLSQIIQTINESHLEIKSINMHQPKLEDVFLHFVGKNIREESSDRMKGIKNMIQMRQLRKR